MPMTTEASRAGEPTARVLLIDDEPEMLELARHCLGDRADLSLELAGTLGEARAILARRQMDLVVTDLLLPDGDGLGLLDEIHQCQPLASTMVISGHPSADSAIGALRHGAADYLAKPFTAAELTQRLDQALATHRRRVHREHRLLKLKDAVRRLNAARKQVGRKVDLLCNDLIGAYSDLSRQLDGVRLRQGYSQFIASCAGLEQLLCHSMDWLLREVGYSNIGIWMVTAEQQLQLGAYMKFTTAAEPALLGALEQNLLRTAIRKGFVRVRDAASRETLTPVEGRYLGGQDIIATTCTYLGEPLGVLLLFRDEKTPFSAGDLTALQAFGPLFALALAQAVRGATPAVPADADDEADTALADEEPADKPRPPVADPADWWKRGEAPPF
jgi:CheY-like chemotaxis protein